MVKTNRLLATQTDVGDWAYPVARDVEVRALPQPNAPVIEKPGMVLLRAMPEDSSNIPTYLRIVTPAGKLCAGGLRGSDRQ